MQTPIWILPHGGSWKVQCNHCGISANCDSREQAISLARAHVREHPAGALSQILIQQTEKATQAEWTYGRDPYPPTN